jgi:hypothetical protein
MSTQGFELPQTNAVSAEPQPDGYHTPFNFRQVKAAEESALGGNGQRSAVCISGGGIRSATFALGALQGLADLGILEHFDYLSTVSGGGYIGSWLTAWKERAKGIKNIIPGLESSAPPVPPGKLDPIQHLREYNNYLSPKLGFFSADTWTLVATVARNMLLNWMVFVPLLMFGLMLPRIIMSLAYLGDTIGYIPRAYAIGAPATATIAGLFFAIGVFNVLRYLPSVGNKDHTEGDFLKFCVGPLFLSEIAVFTMEVWFTGGDTRRHQLPVIHFSGWFWGMTISGLAGWATYLLFHLKQIWKKWKLIAGLTVALLLTTLSLASAAWLLSQHSSDLSWSVYVTIFFPLLLLALALAVTVFVGFTSNVLEDEDREWLARAAAWILLTILTWAAICGLVLLVPVWAFHISAKAEAALDAAGGLSGCLAALAGFSGKAKAQQGAGAQSQKAQSGMTGKLVDIAGKLAAPVFIVVFLTALVLLTNVILWKSGLVHAYWREHSHLLEKTPVQIAAGLAVIFLVFSWIMARYININKFSLQAMYRSRLIRAYLGASNENSHTNPFTGFADNDNVNMTNLTPTLKPFHLVNITLNLVAGERLAWQQRKAESFTVSPLHCGYGDHYRPAKEYAGGISLGTAVAISGAAASPNMGYHSSPAMTFIMTLFNARLGSWLGNPGRDKWKHEGPKSAFDSIVREAFGLTNDSSPYVYLSDGGHFENLAIYEMVRRRCKYIVVLDGGADPDYTYEDLGNALRKIRIDEKVSIQFKPPFLEQLTQSSTSTAPTKADGNGSAIAGLPKNRCAVAEIRYNELDPNLQNGYLIYIKPVVLGNEPPDVIAYKIANDDFPHQSTGDQWFDESQTESYRTLGLWSVTDIFHPWAAGEFDQVVKDAQKYVSQPAPERAVAAASQRAEVAAKAASRRAAAKAATAG